MRKIVLLFTAIIFYQFSAKAQLNKCLVSMEYSPLANTWRSPLVLTLSSLHTKLPFKIDFSFGDGAPNPDNRYSAFEEYKFNFAYLKPGFLFNVFNNEENKSAICIAVNFNFCYMNHDFSAKIEDNLGSTRIVRFNKDAYSWGYQIELIKYKDIGKSMFNFQYGIGLGISPKSSDVLAQYIKTRNGYFNKSTPGIGNGFVAFIGIGTRVFKPKK